jgi:AbrB family looped-hinge helix DNA binding protein
MARAIIRDRRQITLPADICQELDLKIGDAVELEVTEQGSLLATPSRRRALDALAEIRRIFAESGITEAAFQADLRRIRKELVKEKYGIDGT